MFKLFFKKPNIQCPRCLGKGVVDWNDIERLNKSLVWIPGKCAYCNGIGNVHERTIATVPVDVSYLTTNRSTIERWRILWGNKNAKRRAELYQATLNNYIDHIAKQYYVGGLDIETIADLHFAKNKFSDKERKDFLEYAEKIIESQKNRFG